MGKASSTDDFKPPRLSSPAQKICNPPPDKP
ncbi:hypothetical protein SAMN05892877_12028 [Rhizobium subbaraonis]|uniref:Uncharacterized protein n=1 Tax=Rhizobium subbaraonis TaxID=908946 RepID=A0A285UXD2_9HYPH|nr:hypothetical protein SAMN05892877_12028 [Rhizobium subbaraonis]